MKTVFAYIQRQLPVSVPVPVSAPVFPCFPVAQLLLIMSEQTAGVDCVMNITLIRLKQRIEKYQKTHKPGCSFSRD